MKTNWTIDQQAKMQSLAHALVADLKTETSPKQASIVTLAGDLGAGKTTLTQYLGIELGVQEMISSPTFVIAKYYDLPPFSVCESPTKARKKISSVHWRRLIHIDAYRLEGEPLEPLGFGELCADPENFIVIEWPQYIEAALPLRRTRVSITIVQNDVRLITVE